MYRHKKKASENRGFFSSKKSKFFKLFLKKALTNYTHRCIIFNVRQRGNPDEKGSEEMTEGMTNAEFNSFLEQIAKLIEAKAQTPQEAAEIVRDAKVSK